MEYPHLFSPLEIGALELRNRIAMAPMGVGIVDDGCITEAAIRYYEERARGGAGLIISEPCAACYPRGAQSKRQPGVSEDRFIPGLRALTERVHRHGAAIAMQLVHHGKVSRLDTRQGRELLMPSVPHFHGAMDLINDLTGDELGLLIAASPGKPVVHAATQTDIDQLIADIAAAVGRAVAAGFDAIEIHAAHGYLISGFLSPAWNRRDDAYGGSVENRARLLCQVIAAAKQRAGEDFPIWCRLDAVELRTPDGITLADAQRHAELAVAAGADAIHVSAYADATSGPGFTEAPLVHAEAGYASYAESIKRRVGVPVITVGRIEPEVGDKLIADGVADVIAMARKMLADPEIVNKLADDRAQDVRPCIYCYACVAQPFFDRTVHCGVNPSMGHETELLDQLAKPAASPKNVLIIGGGPAGLEAARIAALRGHRVTLLEQAAQLGGRLRYAAALYAPNGRLLRWLVHQVEAAGVGVELGVEATAALIRARRGGLDAVLLAAGSAPQPRAICGDHSHRILDGYHPTAILDRDRNAPAPAIGQRVAILGGNHVSIRIAALLANHGRDVTVLESGDHLAASMAHPLRWRVLHELRERGAALQTNATVTNLTPTSVGFEVARAEGPHRSEVSVDTVIAVGDMAPSSSLVAALERLGIPAIAVGDANGGRTIERAIHDGFHAALSL